LNVQQQDCQYSDSLILFDGKCNPLNAQRPLCFYCWPNGAPTKELVRQFRRNREIKEFIDLMPMNAARSMEYIEKFGKETHDPTMNLDWLMEECFSHNSMLIQIDKTQTKNQKVANFAPQKSPKLSKIRRILRIIFSS